MTTAERWEQVVLAGCVCQWTGTAAGWVLRTRHPVCLTDHTEGGPA